MVACHVRLAPRVADPEPHYDDLVGEVTSYLGERARWAEQAGIPADRIMLDAGQDLGKTPAMSTELLQRSDELAALGYPVFLSVSNKGFLGWLTGREVDDRAAATNAAHALGIGRGCRVLRAHDVAAARRVVDAMDAILSAKVDDPEVASR